MDHSCRQLRSRRIRACRQLRSRRIRACRQLHSRRMRACRQLRSRRIRACRPLHSRSENGHESVVRALVEQGADVKQKNKNGFSPLMFASSR